MVVVVVVVVVVMPMVPQTSQTTASTGVVDVPTQSRNKKILSSQLASSKAAAATNGWLLY